MNMEALLRLENISVRYGETAALHGVNISLERGEIVALMGPNGAGKSTVLKTIFGLTSFHSGRILWHEQEFEPVPHQVVERGIVYVPQGRRIFSTMTVEENLEIGGFVLRDKKDSGRKMEEVMRIFPMLQQKRKAKAGALSGGEQQMLALARGLMADPTVLLLDEPTLGLAPKIVKEVFAKIKEINEKRRTAIVIAEHNIKSLLDVARRVYVLDRGRIVANDFSQEFLSGDMLERVLMGALV